MTHDWAMIFVICVMNRRRLRPWRLCEMVQEAASMMYPAENDKKLWCAVVCCAVLCLSPDLRDSMVLEEIHFWLLRVH